SSSATSTRSTASMISFLSTRCLARRRTRSCGGSFAGRTAAERPSQAQAGGGRVQVAAAACGEMRAMDDSDADPHDRFYPWRGSDLDRVKALSDGVFGVSIT